MTVSGAARPNVLITSVARKVPLVRAFRGATAALGGRVVGADVSPLAAGLYEADEARVVPRSNDVTFIPVLLELCERDDIGLVVPTRDEELPVLAAARDRFAAAGTLVLVSPPDAIEACQDKARFVDEVAAAGLHAPRRFEGGEDIRYPAFVKPRRGKGGVGARRVPDQAALRAALAELGNDAIVQELVDAPELTIDTFLDLAGQPITCVPRERVTVVGGESVVSRTVRDPGLVESTLALCRHLGLVGHVTVQAFRTPDDVLFIEVNPRYGGAATLGFAAGARTPEMAIRMARGEALRPRLGTQEIGLTLLRSAADRFVREGELIGGLPGALPRTAGRDGATPPAAGEPRRAVVFDLDDTLYPEHQFVDGGLRAAASLLARELPEAARRGVEALVARLWELHGIHGRGRLFDLIVQELAGAPDPTLVLAAVHAYRTHPPKLEPFEGIADLVRAMAREGVALGVVSDGLSSVQQRKLEGLGPMAADFEVVVMTDELGPGRAKPSPAGFLVACRRLGVAPANATYVGNDDRKDFRGARAAGLATIRFGRRPDEGGAVDRRRSEADDATPADDLDPADRPDHAADTIADLTRLLHLPQHPSRSAR